MLKRAKKFFTISIICILLGSLQIVFIPFVSYDGPVIRSIISYFISGCLWGFLIAGYIFLGISNRFRKISQTAHGYGKLRRYRLRPGLFNFNTSAEATFFGALTIISFISTVILSIFCAEKLFLASISASIFVFTFQMRCILNGRIYIDLKTLEARRKNDE